MLAFDEAHKYQAWVRADWRQVNVEKMEIALRLKFTQHLDLKAMLLGTGDAELIEVGLGFGLNRLFSRSWVSFCSPELMLTPCFRQDSPRDYFWGIGADNSGRNELGKALMRLREELCTSTFLPFTHLSYRTHMSLPRLLPSLNLPSSDTTPTIPSTHFVRCRPRKRRYAALPHRPTRYESVLRAGPYLARF